MWNQERRQGGCVLASFSFRDPSHERHGFYLCSGLGYVLVGDKRGNFYVKHRLLSPFEGGPILGIGVFGHRLLYPLMCPHYYSLQSGMKITQLPMTDAVVKNFSPQRKDFFRN